MEKLIEHTHVLKNDLKFRNFLEKVTKSKLFESIKPDTKLGFTVYYYEDGPDYLLEVIDGNVHTTLIPENIDVIFKNKF